MPHTTRPVISGKRGVAAAGHYLAAAAGFRIMEQGGNAVDAAAAMCFCLNLLEPHRNGVGGEVPVLVYSAKQRQTFAVCGQGWSPMALTIDWCMAEGIDLIPGDGFIPACVPAVVDTWAIALGRFGTMSFSQVLAPAIELARSGFPVYEALHEYLKSNRQKFAERYPTTAALFYPGEEIPATGELLRNPDLAEMLELLCQAEDKAAAAGRIAGIEAARDAFHKGEITERILDFISQNAVEDATGSEHKGLLSYEDFAEWHAAVEEPVTLGYGGLDIHKCQPWSQGPVFLQQLSLLKGFNLPAAGHNSGEYLHTLVECAKLAFADREAYYGDPAYDSVPLEVLLSDSYEHARRELVGREASSKLRPGDAGEGIPEYVDSDVAEDNRRALGIAGKSPANLGQGHAHLGDTTYLCAADSEGNLVSATPSGGWIGTSPVIPGVGFALGTRAQMFYLNPNRPNALEPRKRPRTTLTPTLVTREGRPYLAFGTPGGDSQDQWTLQFFLNHIVFGMNLQEAIDAPTVHSEHFPSSFYPRKAHPRRMVAEGRISSEVLAELERRGHDVEVVGNWAHGKVMAAEIDAERGTLHAAASSRGNLAYALGW